MPLDINTFKVRATSAVIFGAVMLAALLTTAPVFFIVFAIVVLLAARELYTILNTIHAHSGNESEQIIYAASVVLTYATVAHGAKPVLDFIAQPISILGGAAVLLSLVWLAMAGFKKAAWPLLIGHIYIGLSIGLLVQCYQYKQLWPLLLIVLIWVNDTMQYVVGSLIGKTKMAPIISPKKTWEGTIGGSTLSIIVSILWGLLQKDMPLWQYAAVGAIASIVGTLGDLVESKLKRMAGVKDSGNMMPGHGGALDRFDSLLLAAPFLWLVVMVGK